MVTKVLPLIICLVWLASGVYSCSCAGFQHPQNQFCSSDYVFYGKVTNEQFISGPADDTANNFATWKYTFNIIFKMKGITEGVGQDVVIETAGNGALCGVRLTVGKSLILMGNIIPNWSISYTTTVNYKLSVFRKLVQTQEIANMTLSIQMMVPSALPRRHYAEEKDGAAAGLIMKHVNDLMSSTCEPQWLTESTSNN
ncbi:unnamed protein product [Mytilus edulis]|uniref:NTR domain-containing protein n=1 Tax=Mytilus edulis TaxID=6550 RepID=A0A8S3PQ15_MYTED|nr:unnamed protein product [Mytilus edulis]